MKNILLAGVTIATVSLLGASVFANTTTINTNPRILTGTSGILSVSVLGTDITANPIITTLSSSDLGIDEKKLSQMSETEKQKYIEEKIRLHIEKSGNIDTITASGIISLSGQSMIGTGEIIISSGTLLSSAIAGYEGIQSVTVSATGSGISNPGSVKPLTLLPIKKDNKKNISKKKVRKESKRGK